METAWPEWLTRQQAADYLQVSPSTIYRMTVDHEIEAYYFGRLIRYRKEDLDDAAMPRDIRKLQQGRKPRVEDRDQAL